MSLYTSSFCAHLCPLAEINLLGVLEVAATKDHVLWDRRPVGLAHLSDGVKADETGPKERFDVGLVLVRKNLRPFAATLWFHHVPLDFHVPNIGWKGNLGRRGF